MNYLFIMFCSLVVAVPTEKEQVNGDVGLLVNNLKVILNNIGRGVATSDLSKAISDIMARADAILDSPGIKADKVIVEEVISATTKIIKNHSKTGKLSASVWELSRAINLLADLASDLDLIAGSADNENLYKIAAAVKVTVQAILDRVKFLGEDHIQFDLSQKENVLQSTGPVKRACHGWDLFGLCIGK